MGLSRGLLTITRIAANSKRLPLVGLFVKTLSFGFRFDPIYITIIGNGVEYVIRISYVTKSLVFVCKKPLFAYNPVVLDYKTIHMLPAEASNEQIILPFGNGGALVKTDAAWRDDGIPIIDRLFHSCLLLNAIAYLVVGVLKTISDNRPAIVLTGTDKIYFVTAMRPEFSFPQFTGRRVNV